MGILDKFKKNKKGEEETSKDVKEKSNRQELVKKVTNIGELLIRNIEDLEYPLGEGLQRINHKPEDEKREEINNLLRSYHKDIQNISDKLDAFRRGVTSVESAFPQHDTNIANFKTDLRIGGNDRQDLERLLKTLDERKEKIRSVVEILNKEFLN